MLQNIKKLQRQMKNMKRTYFIISGAMLIVMIQKKELQQ